MTIPIQDLSFTKRPSGSASMHVTYDKYDIWFEGSIVNPDEVLFWEPNKCLYNTEPYADIEVTIDNLPSGSFTFTQYREGTEITPEMMLDVLNEFIRHTKQVVNTARS